MNFVWNYDFKKRLSFFFLVCCGIMLTIHLQAQHFLDGRWLYTTVRISSASDKCTIDGPGGRDTLDMKVIGTTVEITHPRYPGITLTKFRLSQSGQQYTLSCFYMHPSTFVPEEFVRYYELNQRIIDTNTLEGRGQFPCLNIDFFGGKPTEFLGLITYNTRLTRLTPLPDTSNSWIYKIGNTAILEFRNRTGKWIGVPMTTQIMTTGTIEVNSFLAFEGTMTIDTTRYSLRANGKFLVRDIPLPGGGLGALTLSEGEYSLAFAGPDGKLTNFINSALRKTVDLCGVEGLSLKLTDLQIVGGLQSTGIRLSGKITIPGTAKGCNDDNPGTETELEVSDVEIRKGSGWSVGGMKLTDFALAPSFCIRELKATYDPDKLRLAFGASAKMPFMDVGAGFALRGESIDSIAWYAASNTKAIPIGMTGLGLSGCYGSIANIAEGEELEVKLGGVLTTMVLENNLFEGLVGGFYKAPSELGLEGDLSFFKTPVSLDGRQEWQLKTALNGSLNYTLNKLQTSGDVRAGTRDGQNYIVSGNLALAVQYRGGVFRTSARVSGQAKIEKLHNEFPFDWLSETLRLPYTASAEGTLVGVEGAGRKMRTMWMNVNTGSALGNLRFVMDLTKNAQEDGFFFYERLAGGSTFALATTDNKGGTLQAEVTRAIPIAANTERVVIRLKSLGDAPTSVLRRPNGTELRTTSADSSVIMKRSADGKKVFWTLNNPTPGTWTLVASNATAADSISVYTTIGLPTFTPIVQQSGTQITVSWSGTGLAVGDSVVVYADADANGYDGSYLVSAPANAGRLVLSSSQINIGGCSGYIYGYLHTGGRLIGNYATAQILMPQTSLSPPSSIRAEYIASNGTIRVQWLPSRESSVIGYVISVRDVMTGRDSVYAVLRKTATNATLNISNPERKELLMSSYDAASLKGCPSVPIALGTIVPTPGQMLSISAFTPSSGSIGTRVTVSGTNLSNVSAVRFNGVPSLVLSASATTLVTTVPQGATSGPISVSAPSGTAQSSLSFTVIPTSLQLSPTALNIGANGGSVSAQLTANTAWTASSNQTWCTVAPTSGSSNATVNILALANTSSAQRTASITIIGGGVTQTLTLTQAGTSAAQCGGTLTQENGTVSVPANYGANLDCQWLIQPASGQAVRLTFTAFSTESGYDIVRIYDGATPSARLLGAYSGTSLPPAVQSSGGVILVRFTTDGSVAGSGWTMNYATVSSGQQTFQVTPTAVSIGANGGTATVNLQSNIVWSASSNQPWCTLSPASGSTHTTVTITAQANPQSQTRTATLTFIAGANTRTVSVTQAGGNSFQCGGNYTQESGSIVVPANYTADLDCQWLIRPASGRAVRLNFTSFATEEDYDVVSVYDGATINARLLGRFSGTSLPPVLQSSGNAMLIRFVSDGSVSSLGWVATYTAQGAPTSVQTLQNASGQSPIEARIVPNPIGSVAGSIELNLSEAQMVRIVIVDMLGREIAVVQEYTTMSSGLQRIPFPTTNLAAGLYIARLQLGREYRSLPFVVVR